MKDFDVDETINQLTLTEKISLLSGKDTWHTVSIPSKGIRSIRFSDGPNGVRGTKFFNGVPTACFPCGTAMGATFDHELMKQTGILMAKEAKAKGVHVILGPTVNIQRSPLGGRGFESFSEDPLLSGETAADMINGVQSQGIQSCIKHFVANDQEGDRQGYDARISERALREIYLLPFQLAVKNANPACLMTSYNKVNGVHVAEDEYLLRTVLRDEWKYDGLIMSDWFGTYSTAKGIKAGNNLEMPGGFGSYRGGSLLKSVRSRDVAESDIDFNVKPVLKLVNRVQSESNVQENASEGTNDTSETASMLRKIAAESIVLLKNEDAILPLKKNVTTAVIGPNADIATFSGGGSASSNPYYTVTPLQGISAKTKTKYQLGSSSAMFLPSIGRHLKTKDGKPGFDFKCYNAPVSDPERTLIDTFQTDQGDMFMVDYFPKGLDIETPFYVDIEGYLTPEEDGEYEFGCTVFGTALVYIDDQLVVDNATNQREGFIFFGTSTVEERGRINLRAGHKYKYSVTYGSCHTSKLTRSPVISLRGGLRLGMQKIFDREQEIERAVSLAKSVDQVVLCIGLSGEYESEGFDRKHMDLPAGTDELVERVLAANPNTAVVIQSGTPVTLPWVKQAKSIIQAWYGGNETGNAIADVLFGDVNPNGRLPLSWPMKVEDNPAYLNFGSDNGTTVYGEDIYVGYRYYEKTNKEVLFPFGHGLSYSKFEYHQLHVDISNDTLNASIGVTNVGEFHGKEVIQFYLTQKNPSGSRPLKELKGYTKVDIPPGETAIAKVSIPLSYAVSYWDNAESKWIREKDEYIVAAGSSSSDIRSTAEFKIDQTIRWTGI